MHFSATRGNVAKVYFAMILFEEIALICSFFEYLPGKMSKPPTCASGEIIASPPLPLAASAMKALVRAARQNTIRSFWQISLL